MLPANSAGRRSNGLGEDRSQSGAGLVVMPGRSRWWLRTTRANVWSRSFMQPARTAGPCSVVPRRMALFPSGAKDVRRGTSETRPSRRGGRSTIKRVRKAAWRHAATVATSSVTRTRGRPPRVVRSALVPTRPPNTPGGTPTVLHGTALTAGLSSRSGVRGHCVSGVRTVRFEGRRRRLSSGLCATRRTS